jgi:MFS family permease
MAARTASRMGPSAFPNSLPLEALLGGLVASYLGLRAPFYLGAACLAGMAIVLAPVLTTRALDEATGRKVQPTEETQADE